MDYNGKYTWKDLLNLNYDGINVDRKTSGDEQNQINNISNDIGDFRKDLGTNSFDENFHNDYE